MRVANALLFGRTTGFRIVVVRVGRFIKLLIISNF